jgi:hypothetical protein
MRSILHCPWVHLGMSASRRARLSVTWVLIGPLAYSCKEIVARRVTGDLSARYGRWQGWLHRETDPSAKAPGMRGSAVRPGGEEGGLAAPPGAGGRKGGRVVLHPAVSKAIRAYLASALVVKCFCSSSSVTALPRLKNSRILFDSSSVPKPMQTSLTLVACLPWASK